MIQERWACHSLGRGMLAGEGSTDIKGTIWTVIPILQLLEVYYLFLAVLANKQSWGG